MNEKAKKDLINALELLNNAAHEERDEIAQIIHEKYDDLSNLFDSKKKFIAKKVAEGEERIKDAAANIEEKVKEHPWPYVAGAAAIAFAFGALLEAKHSHK